MTAYYVFIKKITEDRRLIMTSKYTIDISFLPINAFYKQTKTSRIIKKRTDALSLLEKNRAEDYKTFTYKLSPTD